MLTAFASQRKEVWPSWPLFGRRRTLNVATYCAPVSSISAGQQRNGQVAGTRDTVYGSDANRPMLAGVQAGICGQPGAHSCNPNSF